MISFTCPECKDNVKARNSEAGKKARCNCGNVVVIPPSGQTNKSVLREPSRGLRDRFIRIIMVALDHALSFFEQKPQRLLVAAGVLIVTIVVLGFRRAPPPAPAVAHVVAQRPETRERRPQPEPKRTFKSALPTKQPRTAPPTKNPDKKPQPPTPLADVLEPGKERKPGLRILSTPSDVVVPFVNGRLAMETQQREPTTLAKPLAAASPDGRLVAYRLLNRIDLWDVQRQCRQGVVRIDTGWRAATPNPYELRFSPDGNFLATIDMSYVGTVQYGRLSGKQSLLASGVLRLIDTKSLVQKGLLTGPIKKSESMRLVEGVDTFAFAADSSQIAVAFDSTVKIWSLKTMEVEAVLENTARIGALSYTPDGRTLISGDDDGMLRFWNTKIWRNVHSVQPHRDGKDIEGVRVLGDGRCVAVRFHRKLKRLSIGTVGWRLNDAGLLAERLWNKLEPVFSADGKLLAAMENVTLGGRLAKGILFYDPAQANRWSDGIGLPERMKTIEMVSRRWIVGQGDWCQLIALDLVEREAVALGEPHCRVKGNHLSFVNARNKQRGAYVTRSEFRAQIVKTCPVGNDILTIRRDGRVDLWRVAEAAAYAKTQVPEPLKLNGKMRRWTDDNRLTIEARLVGLHDGVVELQPKGRARNIFVSTVRLIPNDQEEVLGAAFTEGPLLDWHYQTKDPPFRAALVRLEGPNAMMRLENGKERFMPYHLLDRPERKYLKWIRQREQSRLARRFQKMPDRDEVYISRLRTAEKSLQGVWRVIKAPTVKDLANNGMRVYIRGNLIWMQRDLPNPHVEFYPLRFSIDPTRKPAVFDRYTYAGGGQLGGIYELRGRTLRLNLGVSPGRAKSMPKYAMELRFERKEFDMAEIRGSLASGKEGH